MDIFGLNVVDVNELYLSAFINLWNDEFSVLFSNLRGHYRSGTVNSNTVNSKFHLIRNYCKYLATILSVYV